VAAHVAAESSQFNCKTCKWGRHCDESNPAKLPDWFSIPGVIDSRTCFLPMISAETHRYMRLYTHYKNHFLPHAGGIADQPHHYIEAMELLDKTLNQIQAAQIERERKRAERDNH